MSGRPFRVRFVLDEKNQEIIIEGTIVTNHVLPSEFDKWVEVVKTGNHVDVMGVEQIGHCGMFYGDKICVLGETIAAANLKAKQTYPFLFFNQSYFNSKGGNYYLDMLADREKSLAFMCLAETKTIGFFFNLKQLLSDLKQLLPEDGDIVFEPIEILLMKLCQAVLVLSGTQNDDSKLLSLTIPVAPAH